MRARASATRARGGEGVARAGGFAGAVSAVGFFPDAVPPKRDHDQERDGGVLLPLDRGRGVPPPDGGVHVPQVQAPGAPLRHRARRVRRRRRRRPRGVSQKRQNLRHRPRAGSGPAAQ